MTTILGIINFILHLDSSLYGIIQNYGFWTYLLLFLIIFCETGLVFTPFLPGDSLIFAAGALAAMGSLNVFVFFTVFFFAAVIGDTVNYQIGKKFGAVILGKQHHRLVKMEHLNRANQFYEKHGSLTIVIGRFIPIIRTFVPFVAGIGNMNYSKFIGYNILGGFLWVSLFLLLGTVFGNIPIVKDNFSFVLIAIIVISIIPAILAVLSDRKASMSS
jgi:membrane-associated protein